MTILTASPAAQSPADSWAALRRSGNLCPPCIDTLVDLDPPTMTAPTRSPFGDGACWTCGASLSDAEPKRFVCTGRGAGVQEACTFATNDAETANQHFERYDHDVEEHLIYAPDALTCDDVPAYLEIPLEWDANDERYEHELGEVRVSLTIHGFTELLTQVGCCPCCNRPMAEGERH